MNLYDELLDNVVNFNVEKSRGVIPPDSLFKIIWDVLGMIFILYQVIVIPYRMCFDENSYGGMAAFELTQDFYFILDIVITAFTGYYDKGNLIMTSKKIILNYLKLWLWLDILASFPYSMVISIDDYLNIYSTELSNKLNAPQILRLLKFMKFLRFLRLIRVLKLKRLLAKVRFLNKLVRRVSRDREFPYHVAIHQTSCNRFVHRSLGRMLLVSNWI